MAENARRNLPYGHFGRAAYSLDDEEWQFERHLSAPQSVCPLPDDQESSQRDVHPPLSHDAPPREPQARRFRRQIRGLVEHIPELQAAEDLLPELLRVSEATQAATSRHDSTQGTLISATNIRSNASHKIVRIAALPTGDTRSTLRLSQVQKQKRGWAGDKKCWINVPTLSGEDMLWEQNEGPIQQITFAEPVDRGEPLLGVRLLRKTLIFRPTHGVKGNGAVLLASGIQANKLHGVGLDATGGVPHADVAFNPWFSQQVAIVDQAGSWTVLEFQSRKLSQIARSWSGLIGSTIPSDGWARIRWMLNLETVAVCTRQSFALFSIAEDQARRVHLSTPDIASGSQWILDFAVLPGHSNHCALLTSTHLIIYEVSSCGLQGVKVSTLLVVEHFRNPEETSMRMASWSSDDSVYILLYTATSKSGPLYRLEIPPDAQLRLYDPVGFRLQNDKLSHSILDLSVSSISWSDDDPLANGERGARTQCVSVAMVLSNNTVVERLLHWTSDGRDARPSLPTWESKLRASSTRKKHAQFVVDDEVDDLHETGPASSPVALRRARMPVARLPGPHRVAGLSRAAQALLTPAQDAHSLERVLGGVKNAFNADENTILPMRTLQSLLPVDLITTDLDSISEALDGASMLLSEASSEAPRERLSLQLSMLASPPVIDLANELRTGSVIAAYDEIVAAWIGSLSDDVSGRVRIAKAALARKIATQLVLANRIIHVHKSESLALTQASNVADSVAAWDLPVRPSAFTRNDTNVASLDVIRASQYSALPTPSPSATPSVATMSTGISGFAAPELFRLSGLASFNKPSPSVLSRPMNKILSHWRLGESPMDYDWQSKSKHLQREEEDEDDEEMTEKERKRLHRRAERHIRRQRKEAEASQALQMASSQAPEIMTASQPMPVLLESQPVAASSQPSLARTVAASQALPGRFGGRPLKKKRKSGF